MKKKSLTTYAKVTAGKLVYKDQSYPERLAEFLNDHEDKIITEKHEVVRDVKSYEQLRFYFGVLIPAMCHATGTLNRDEMDAQLRYHFLKEVKEGPVETYVSIPTLSIDVNKVDKVMMSQYISDCLDLLAECGGSIDAQEINNYESVTLDDIPGQLKLFGDE